MAPKMQPAVQTVVLKLDNVEAATHVYADIGQIVSIVNRRMYRQGLNWAVEGFTLITNSTASGFLNIQSLQTTWCQFNAWQKTYSAWKDQQDEAMKDADATSAIARYRDFKIHFDDLHQAAGFAANLTPIDAGLNVAYQLGEWDRSQIVIPNDGGVAGNTVEYELHMHGADAVTSKALITNYQNARATPQSPAPSHQIPQNTFFNEMHDVGEQLDDVIVNAMNQNDDLPYTQDNYPGGGANAASGQYVSGITLIPANNIRRHLSMRGGQFPCGLIKINHDLSEGVPDPNFPGARLLIHLVPGEHRGYTAIPMQEF